MIDLSTHHALRLLIRLQVDGKCKLGIRVWKKKKKSKTQFKSKNKNRWWTVKSYFKFIPLVAFLKPVPAGLIFPEQAHFMTFSCSYHKSQGWKEYRYRTTTLLKGPFVPACRQGSMREACWLLLILYLYYIYNLKSGVPSAGPSIWCSVEALNSEWNIKTQEEGKHWTPRQNRNSVVLMDM